MKYILIICSVVILVAAMLVIDNKALFQTPSLPKPTLKELAAERGIQLGNFATLKRLDEPPFRTILTEQFHFVLADGQPNWQFVGEQLRPSKDEYDFHRLDQVIDFAQRHNMPIQSHHYVWGEEKWLPVWLKNGDYSKEELLAITENHIKTVGGRYKGQIREWTVVNEHFTRRIHLFGLTDWWQDHIGEEYVDNAFIWAREADPNATLILNDFYNEYLDFVSNSMFDYVKDAKARGVPIDAVGMQMHIDGKRPPTKDEVMQNMRRFSELGVKVYVTEFDVNMNDAEGSREEKLEKEATIYYDMLRACIEVGRDICPSFAYLGITDKESWYNELGVPEAMPLMFDEKYRPKPAYYAIRRALEQP